MHRSRRQFPLAVRLRRTNSATLRHCHTTTDTRGQRSRLSSHLHPRICMHKHDNPRVCSCRIFDVDRIVDPAIATFFIPFPCTHTLKTSRSSPPPLLSRFFVFRNPAWGCIISRARLSRLPGLRRAATLSKQNFFQIHSKLPRAARAPFVPSKIDGFAGRIRRKYFAIT